MSEFRARDRKLQKMLEAELEDYGVTEYEWEHRGSGHSACIISIGSTTETLITHSTGSDRRADMNSRATLRRLLKKHGLTPKSKTKKVRPESCGPGGQVPRKPTLDQLDKDFS